MIVYTPAAKLDIQNILQPVYTACRDEETTLNYVNALVEKVEKKERLPRSGTPLYWKSHFTGYFFVVYKAYIAFYRIEGDGIVIERILPSKSDFGRWLPLG